MREGDLEGKNNAPLKLRPRCPHCSKDNTFDQGCVLSCLTSDGFVDLGVWHCMSCGSDFLFNMVKARDALAQTELLDRFCYYLAETPVEKWGESERSNLERFITSLRKSILGSPSGAEPLDKTH